MVPYRIEGYSEVNEACIYFGLMTMNVFIDLKFAMLGSGFLYDYKVGNQFEIYGEYRAT